MGSMSHMGIGPNTALQRFGQLVIGLYAWTTAVYFGCVWLDVIYARLAIEPGAAFHAVPDVLLALVAGMIVLGMVAITLTGNSPAAMKLLVASVILALLMIPAPMLLSGVLQGAASTLGAPIRVLLTACVSGMAFLGFDRYERQA
ncbi:MAG: hypothetical protein ACK2T0_04930 [Anaerolineales bacterium]